MPIDDRVGRAALETLRALPTEDGIPDVCDRDIRVAQGDVDGPTLIAEPVT